MFRNVGACIGNLCYFKSSDCTLYCMELVRKNAQMRNCVTYLNILQPVAHVVHAHIITNNSRIQAVCVWVQQLRPPPHSGRASLQAQDLTRNTASHVRAAEPILALPARPRLLLVRRRRLV